MEKCRMLVGMETCVWNASMHMNVDGCASDIDILPSGIVIRDMRGCYILVKHRYF